jgi:hypothetical protein
MPKRTQTENRSDFNARSVRATTRGTDCRPPVWRATADAALGNLAEQSQSENRSDFNERRDVPDELRTEVAAARNGRIKPN